VNALIALALVAAAESQAREAAPPPATPKPFRVPAPRRLQLDNGLKITLVEYGAVPKARVALSVRSGNIDEAADQVWLADLTGDALIEGTAARTATEIAEAAARMGGSVDVAVNPDWSRIAGEVLSEFAPEQVRLVADVARNPRFAPADVERRKADRARQLAISRSQPQSLAQEKFLAALYPGHPYGRLFPTPQMLAGFTPEHLRAFHDQNFGAARSHLYVVGRFDPAAVEAAARQAFGDWKRGTEAKSLPPAPRAERKVWLVDRPGALQSTISLGLPVLDPKHPDWIAFQVTNYILGGSFMSRVTSNIREQKGYTYSPFSSVTWHRGDAHWVQSADVTTKDTGASLKEIFAEIDRLRREPPGDAELTAIQNYANGIFVLQNSSRTGIASLLEFVDLNGLPDDYLSTYVDKLRGVKPQDVQRLAARYLIDDKTAIVVVGDLKTVREQVAPYGPAVE